MGLDSVEIVINVEGTFGISITNSEARETTTPGQLIDLVLAKTEKSKGSISRQQVSEGVRQIVVDILCCEKEYREDAHFVYDLGMT